MTASEVFNEFGAAVFRVEASGETGSEIGTGYLVDAERGYVLTAFHVVKHAYKAKAATITATNPRLPGEVLQLEIVDRLEDPEDLALLSVMNLATIAQYHIRPLDIAVHFPPGNTYFTIGYPRGKSTPNAQTAELQGRSDDDRYLDVKQDVDEGSSGSPLIDENGAVLATCVAFLNKSEAEYSPIMDAEKLLLAIPPDSRVATLDAQIRSAGRTQKDALRHLLEQLKWRSGNASNLELLEWAGQIVKKETDPPLQPFVACPMVPAYSDRRLSDLNVVQRISSFAPPRARAQVLLNLANQSLFLGRHAAAENQAGQAATLYRDSADTVGQSQALAALGRADLYQAKLDSATKALSQSVALEPSTPADARTMVYLAQAYAQSGNSSSALQSIHAAVPNLLSTKDTTGQALSFDTLGRVAAIQGDFSLASRNFERAQALCSEADDKVCEESAKDSLVRLDQKQAQQFRFDRRQRSKQLALNLGLPSFAILLALSWLILRFIIRR